MQLVYPPPPKFYKTIVLDFSLDDRNTLEKLETMVLQNFGEGRGVNKVHYGLWCMKSHSKRPAVVALSLYIVIQNSLPELMASA